MISGLLQIVRHIIQVTFCIELINLVQHIISQQLSETKCTIFKYTVQIIQKPTRENFVATLFVVVTNTFCKLSTYQFVNWKLILTVQNVETQLFQAVKIQRSLQILYCNEVLFLAAKKHQLFEAK